jgi:hypothetical protein
MAKIGATVNALCPIIAKSNSAEQEPLATVLCRPSPWFAEQVGPALAREKRQMLVTFQSVGARCRVRTCDFLRVKQALYH